MLRLCNTLFRGSTHLRKSSCAGFASTPTKSKPEGPGALKYVSIRASDVSAAIGRNNFKPASEVFNELWQRYSPANFTGTTRIDAQLESFKMCSVEEQAQLLQAVKLGGEASDAKIAARQLETAASIIRSSAALSESDKAQALALMTGQVYTQHGTIQEDKIVNKVAQRDGARFTKDNNIYSLPICEIDGVKYVVRGKIDRIQTEADGELVLVEVKTRMNKCFYEVREYERVQILTYLRMLPPIIRRAKLIEQHMETINEMWVEREDDDAEWKEEIAPALKAFCIDLHESMLGGRGREGVAGAGANARAGA
jgi:hypothetical protein